MAINSDDGVTVVGDAYGAQGVVAVVRWTEAGALDTNFGDGGIATLADDGFDIIGSSVAIDGNGRTLVAAWAVERHPDVAVVYRLNRDGSLDSTFASGGVARLSILSSYGETCCIALDHEGNIVVAGTASDASDGQIVVARLNGNGALDTTFGSYGVVSTTAGFSYAQASAVAIDNQGRILIAGGAADYSYGVPVLVHFNRDGTLNESVGSGGVYSTPFGLDSSLASSLVVDANGRPTVVINADDRDGDIPVLVRYDELFGDGFD